MLDISDVPEYFNVNMLSNYKLAEIGIPLERFSEDKARVNKYGPNLVSSFVNVVLYILPMGEFIKINLLEEVLVKIHV
jgi:hypothetical protein